MEQDQRVRRSLRRDWAKAWGSWAWMVRAVKMRASATRVRESIGGLFGDCGGGSAFSGGDFCSFAEPGGWGLSTTYNRLFRRQSWIFCCFEGRIEGCL